MALYEATHQIALRAWVCLTPTGPVTAARVQCQGPYGVHLLGNQSPTVPPATVAGSLRLSNGEVMLADRLTADYFPADVTGGAAYLWAYSEETSSVSVQHA